MRNADIGSIGSYDCGVNTAQKRVHRLPVGPLTFLNCRGLGGLDS